MQPKIKNLKDYKPVFSLLFFCMICFAITFNFVGSILFFRFILNTILRFLYSLYAIFFLHT